MDFINEGFSRGLACMRGTVALSETKKKKKTRYNSLKYECSERLAKCIF
jgi:hypothetical protein